MLNQKHNVFKGQKSKSKIFITILCIFGLLFSWSCSCKNNVTGPGNDGLEDGKAPDITPQGDKTIFSLTEDEATNQANNWLIYSSKLSKTNSLVIVKYKEQADHLFSAALNVVEDKGSTGLTAEMFEYNAQNGRLTLKDTGVDKVKGLTDGEIKEIKIEFTFKPTDTTLTNIKGQTVFTNAIQVVKTKVLTPSSEYGTAMGVVGGGGIDVYSETPGLKASFMTKNPTTTASKITIELVGDADIGTIKTTKFKSAFNADSKSRTFDNFSSVIIIDDGVISGTIATFTVQFTLKDKSLELYAGDGTFTLDVDIASSYNAHKDTVKWEI